MGRERVAARAVRSGLISRRGGVGLVVGLALGALLEGATPMAGPIQGRVEVSAGLQGPVELQLIPEDQLTAFLQLKRAEARARFERIAVERAALKVRLRQWEWELERADEELARSSMEILLRRLEAVRHAVSVRELETQRRLLTAQGNAVRRRAFQVRQQAEWARREWEHAEEAAQRLEDGSYFLSALPLPVVTAHLEPGEHYRAELPGGRYALVATAAGRGRSTRVWLLWTRVRPGESESLVLKEDNLALSDCETCVLAPPGPVVNR